MIGTETKYIL